MATNASTWFYSEPENQPYLIEERVNHTFWSNRVTALHLHCTQAESPFRMEGEWHGEGLVVEWVPNDYLTLTTRTEIDSNALLIGFKEVLGFAPTISYVDSSGKLTIEWHIKQANQRIQEIQGNPNYSQIKRYTT